MPIYSGDYDIILALPINQGTSVFCPFISPGLCEMLDRHLAGKSITTLCCCPDQYLSRSEGSYKEAMGIGYGLLSVHHW